MLASFCLLLLNISTPVSAHVTKSKKTVITSEDGSVVLTQIKKNVWVHTTSTEIQGNKVGANGLIIW